MIPSIPAQYDEYRTSTVPGLHGVANDVWVLGLPLSHASAGMVAYTLCYVLRDRHGLAHLIDPGDGNDKSLERLRQALLALGLRRVGSVIVTHRHPDHLGAAERIQREHGANIVLGSAEFEATEAVVTNSAIDNLAPWGVPSDQHDDIAVTGLKGWTVSVVPSRLVDEGDALVVPGHDLKVFRTAGHTNGHLCFLDETRAILYTGDHVLPTVQPGIGFDGFGRVNPLDAYLESLDRLRSLDHCVVAPGHGYVFEGLDERINAIRSHHLRRTREVQSILAENPSASVWEVATRLRWRSGNWDDLPSGLRFAALHQTANHARYLLEGNFV